MKSLMNKLNDNGPNIEPCGTPPVTGFQPHLCHWSQPLETPVIHTALKPPHCPRVQSALPELSCDDIIRGSVKSLPEVQVDNTHYSSLILQPVVPHRRQSVWLSMAFSSMQTAPDHLLVFLSHQYTLFLF